MIEGAKFIQTGVLGIDEAIITFSYSLAEDFRDITQKKLSQGEVIKTDPKLELFINDILTETGKNKTADLRRARKLLLEVGQSADLVIYFEGNDLDVDFARRDIDWGT